MLEKINTCCISTSAAGHWRAGTRPRKPRRITRPRDRADCLTDPGGLEQYSVYYYLLGGCRTSVRLENRKANQRSRCKSISMSMALLLLTILPETCDSGGGKKKKNQKKKGGNGNGLRCGKMNAGRPSRNSFRMATDLPPAIVSLHRNARFSMGRQRTFIRRSISPIFEVR